MRSYQSPSPPVERGWGEEQLMIIIDTLLQKRADENNPIKVGIIGAGFMGAAIIRQICKYKPGIKAVAVYNRHIQKAREAYNKAGVTELEEPTTVAGLESNIAAGKYSITDDATLLCDAEGIEAIIEITGALEFGAKIAWRAIHNRKHIILMNAELDCTIGPLLKVYADKMGVIYTNVDGDQPVVIMNLYREVKGMGIKPVLCGNIKGLQDPYRTPATQEAFARQWNQKPEMVASFADGSKMNYEQAIVANGTGMRVAKRGMHGPTVPPNTTIKEVVNLFHLDDVLTGPGIVDYVVGISEPAPGIFVLGTTDDPVQQWFLKLYKLGDGPLYLFYEPYHLCHLLAANTIARAVLLGDAALAPLGKPYVEVVATAKRDLKKGEIIDGIGWYMTYGECENADIRQRERLLPLGLAEGCVLKRDIARDATLTFDDVIVPEGRFVDQLYKEQEEYFSAKT